MLVIGAEHRPPAVLATHQTALGLFYLRRKKDPRNIAGLALQYVILSPGHSSLTVKMGSGWGRLGLYSNGPHKLHPPTHTQLCESLASLLYLLPSSP